jgi:hypothetical protein
MAYEADDDGTGARRSHDGGGEEGKEGLAESDRVGLDEGEADEFGVVDMQSVLAAGAMDYWCVGRANLAGEPVAFSASPQQSVEERVVAPEPVVLARRRCPGMETEYADIFGMLRYRERTHSHKSR